MQWTTTIRAALGVLALCALTACGGDREQAETGPRTYSGTLSDGRAIYAALHDSGEYSITYSAANEPSKIAGVIQGHSTSIDGTFEAQDSHHFNFEENGQGKVSIVGTHVPNQSFEGTLQHAGAAQQHSFTSTASVGSDPMPSGDISKLASEYEGVFLVLPVVFSLDRYWDGRSRSLTAKLDGCTSFAGAIYEQSTLPDPSVKYRMWVNFSCTGYLDMQVQGDIRTVDDRLDVTSKLTFIDGRNEGVKFSLTPKRGGFKTEAQHTVVQ